MTAPAAVLFYSYRKKQNLIRLSHSLTFFFILKIRKRNIVTLVRKEEEEEEKATN